MIRAVRHAQGGPGTTQSNNRSPSVLAPFAQTLSRDPRSGAFTWQGAQTARHNSCKTQQAE
eukprot:8234555-Alexandrium_andersonii.AAC.1